MKPYIKAVGTGQRLARDLTPQEAEEAFRLILNGQSTDAQLGAFLVALRIKGESIDEMTSFLKVAREGLNKLHVPCENLLDIGSPYDGKKKTPHAAPAAALIAAGAGARVILHSDHQVPPKYGVTIQDVLQKLGVDVHASVGVAQQDIEKLGVAYLSMENVHPRFHGLKRVRIEINLRTFLNNVEKIWNPANASHQLVSIYHGPFLPTIANTLAANSKHHALVVQGMEGSTDVWLHRPTKGLSVQNGQVTEWTVVPKDLGLAVTGQPSWDARVDPAANAHQIERVLEGEKGVFRDWVLLNAAIWIWLSGLAASVLDGLEKASESLDCGKAAEKLRLWRASAPSVKL